MGGGDLKLMAALGAAAGPAHWMRIFLYSAFIGGLAALVYTLIHSRFRHTLSNMGVILKSLARGKAPHRASPELDVRSPAGARLPHAVMIASATALHLFLTWWLAQ
jgi:prepilin peptidase CpaA